MDYYIICDNSYNKRVRFSKAEWEELLTVVQTYFDLPPTKLDEELLRRNIASRELPELSKEKIDKMVTDEIAEWEERSILDKYHPQKGQMAVVSGEGAEKWLEILESSHLDEYFRDKEKQRQEFINLCKKEGEFGISYKPEEQA